MKTANEIKELEAIAEWSAELRIAALNMLDKVRNNRSDELGEAANKLEDVLNKMEER